MVHQYVFEFKYKKVVFGKEIELTHGVNVLDNNYQSACKKAMEHTKDHFHQWNDEGSSFKYVGEKINGVLKPFVEEVKGEEKMKTYVEMYEEMCGALTGKAMLRFAYTYRSFDEQNHLYAQGRTKPGKIVTYAKGGQSYHNFGLAFENKLLTI